MTVLPLLRWCVSLGIKFIRVVPWQTLAIVVLTLISQVASVVAFFLPLKVVILLGSDGIPKYFPSSWVSVDRDVLIVSLSIATIGFFLLYLIAEKLTSWVTLQGTNRLLARSQKVILFKNQAEVAAGAYQRYSRTLASGVFILLALVGIVWIYPPMALVTVGYVLFSGVILAGLYHGSPAMRDKLEYQLSPTLKVVGGIGFFIAFGFLVADFVLWIPPGLIVAIVTILLVRQLTTRAIALVSDLVALQKQRTKVEALFFHGKVLKPATVRSDKSIWFLLTPGTREQVAEMVLQELISSDRKVNEAKWHQTGIVDVAALSFRSNKVQYLLKIYDPKRHSQALHEVTLVGESVHGLPSPEFIGTTIVQKFSCLLYRLPSGKPPATHSVKRVELQIRRRLLVSEPPSDIVGRYIRSKPMLWQRLDGELLVKLKMAASTPEHTHVLQQWSERLLDLRQILQGLPLTVHVPDIAQDQLWVPDEAEYPLLLHWGRWELEPLGSGWPIRHALLSMLAPTIENSMEKRTQLANVEPLHAELAALSYALDKHCTKQRYVQALELLPEILKRLKSGEMKVPIEAADANQIYGR